MIPRFSSSDLREALSGELVANHYALRVKRRGSQLRMMECPRCRERSTREAIAIDIKTGSWCHHGFEDQCSGDVLDLIAACEGLSCKRDFRRVAEIAAEIAGVVDEDAIERERRITAAKERARQAAVAELERLTRNRSTAAAAWGDLSLEDSQNYLASRGLDASALGGIARFSSDGVAVAIRDADGTPMSIATRLYEPGERPKVLVLRGHSTKGTMIDAPCDIVHGRDVVLVEGVMDSLTARLAWPRAVILGVNGAGALGRTAESVIGRIRVARARLLLVPHADEQGIRNATIAGQVALAAGLELESSLQVIGLPAKDLNDAWKAGWRP